MNKLILFVALALLSLPSLARAQSTDTIAARQFAAWLAAFNSGDRATLREFLESKFPSRVARLDGDLGFRERTGGFDLKKSEESTPTKFSGLLKERDSDQFARVVVEVEAAEPHHITRLELNAIPRPTEFAMPRLSEGEALAALRSRIDLQVAAEKFAGAIIVAKNGKPVFSGAYGLADREKKVSNQLSTRFRVGSMNKMFTAVATLQLAQAGKLRLTDTIGTYLTDYPNKNLASKVTIHHLLTHTGGTGDIFGPQFDARRTELRTLQDYVSLYGTRDVEFEPGSRWAYSNYGFLLLGVVVEKVSGESYYDYVRDHIFKPAGMTASGSAPEGEAAENRSVGYTKFGGKNMWTPNTETLPFRGTSAGGGYATVEDLVRFADALARHKLLDAEHTKLLTTGKVTARGPGKYAYGFFDGETDGVRSFGHGGGAPGMNGELQIYPQSGYVVAVLANMDPPAASRIADFIGNRLPVK